MTAFRAARWLAHTSWPLYAATVLGSNLVGAVGIYLFLKHLVPMSEFADLGAPDHSALSTVALAYIAAAIVVGAVATGFLFRPILQWQRHPEQHDRNMVRNLVLRMPLYQALVCAVVWVIGIGILTAYASSISARMALVLAIATLLTGAMVVLITYLEATRIIRPVAAAAMARRYEDSTLEPPVYQRLMLTWVLTTAGPLVGILLLVWGQSSGYFTDSAKDVMPALFALVITAMVAGFISMLLVSMSVVDPIVEMQAAINKVRRGETDTMVDIYDGSEIGALQAGFNEMMRGLRERQRVRDLFGRYVGDEVARRALEESPTLGGEDRRVAVLFVDIIGSTTFAMDHSPAQVVAALNEFFEQVVDIVHQHKGIINKFEGDAALAVFGAPLPLTDSTSHALAAARDLKATLNPSPLPCGIGVASGRVVAGHIGGHDRFEYTVIGDAVNTAARLTELAKDTPGRVLTNAATLREANAAEQARWTVLKSIELRGRKAMTQLARPIRATLADRS